GASLVAEVFPPDRRIAGGALLYTSAPLGILLAGFVNDLFTRRLGWIASQPDLGWRLVFLSGLVPAALALWIRRAAPQRGARLDAPGPPARLGDRLGPAHRRATLGALALAVVTLVTWWGMSAFLPFVMRHAAGPDATADATALLVTRANTWFTIGGF